MSEIIRQILETNIFLESSGPVYEEYKEEQSPCRDRSPKNNKYKSQMNQAANLFVK